MSIENFHFKLHFLTNYDKIISELYFLHIAKEK